jgi:lipoprotein signal peptidase
MRPYRVLLRGQGVFFAAQSSAGCITNISGFDLRQAQPSGRPILAMGLTLILGGALGNMLDRARIGSVIDFVHVSYKAWSFAAFNFADAAITMGVIATIVSTYLETPSVYADSQG